MPFKLIINKLHKGYTTIKPPIFSYYMMLVMLCLMLLQSCKPSGSMAKNDNQSELVVQKTDFDTIIDGKAVSLITLKNNKGSVAQFTNFGGRWVTMIVKDNQQKDIDVIVGPGNITNFNSAKEKYFGATIGRFGNRIAKGKFSIAGFEYSTPTNNGPNMLHGGSKGFNDVVWNYETKGDTTVIFSYTSIDGEQGFPGTLLARVSYTLTDTDDMLIEYEATTDKTTVVNLTNHAFFNLNGIGSGTINDHLLQIKASNYTPIDETLIPTGSIESVSNTPFDFMMPTAIGKSVGEIHPQLTHGSGYDHNFVLDRLLENELESVAIVKGNLSGVVMEILTVEPGLQFYGGNFMKSNNVLKKGVKDDYRTAFCLETQHFPDAPNHPNFPSTLLNPGETYTSKSVYKFYVDPK